MPEETQHNTNSGVPWWALAAMLLAFVVVILIGVRVAGVLSALLFPPAPPLPPGVQEISHNSPAYGFDEWEYHLRPSPCFTIEYYEDEGATCVREPGHCQEDGQRKTSAFAATCTGQENFSNFAMRYEVEIYAYPDHTEIYLDRETAWTRSGSPE